MRVSSQQMIQNAISAMQRQNEQLMRVQQQLASGQRMIRPSDDPAAHARASGMRQILTEFDQFGRNLDSAEATLVQQESLLGDILGLLQATRDQVLQAQNGINDAAALGGIREQLQQNLQHLLHLANSQNADGEYLFAGSRSLTQPFFQDNVGQVQFAGDPQERQLALSEQRNITTGISGDRLFMRLPTGQNGLESVDDPANTGTGLINGTHVQDAALLTGDRYEITFSADDSYDIVNLDSGAVVALGVPYTPGDAITFEGIRLELSGTPLAGDRFRSGPARLQDIFSGLQQFIDSLDGQASVTTHLANQANRALENLDHALQRINTEQAMAGARLVAVDNVREANIGLKTQFQVSLSEIEDLDYLEAAGRLNQHSLALEAAQQALVLVQRLSLFNYL